MKDKFLRELEIGHYTALESRILRLEISRDSLAELYRELGIGKTSTRLQDLERKIGADLANNETIRQINVTVYNLISRVSELQDCIKSINDKLEIYINQPKGEPRDVS
jgi:uncharacterized coiled-coil protein SlyX